MEYQIRALFSPKTQEQAGSQLEPNRGEMKSTNLQKAREKAASKKPAKVEVGSRNPLED